MGNMQIIQNKTFELGIRLRSAKKVLQSNIILCGSSWNGLIYLIAPINNNIVNANWYMIDEYNPNKSKQIAMIEFPYGLQSSNCYIFDNNLYCTCVISTLMERRIQILLMQMNQ